jgi:hypothetical protein
MLEKFCILSVYAYIVSFWYSQYSDSLFLIIWEIDSEDAKCWQSFQFCIYMCSFILHILSIQTVPFLLIWEMDIEEANCWKGFAFYLYMHSFILGILSIQTVSCLVIWEMDSEDAKKLARFVFYLYMHSFIVVFSVYRQFIPRNLINQ